jgi:uncharacterized LabA/DUF88 family protein
MNLVPTFVFIDAANLFYGGKKSLGWSIDYEKLRIYLERKYQASRIYYFGGVEIHRFHFDYLLNDTVPVRDLERYLADLIKEKGDEMNDAELKLLSRHYNRVRFFKKLEKFGYTLMLKPVKTYNDTDGNPLRKANCDVDMTLLLATEKDSFVRAIVLSGDGDFLPVLKYLRQNKKEVLVLARGPRTAKEIKRFAGSKFLDFEYLRTHIEFEEK